MDEVGMKLWIEKVWQSWLCSLLRKKSRLVWDSFQAHLVDSVKRAARQKKNDIAVILGRLTSILQLLEIFLNKPFKDRLCEQWDNWMIEGQKSFTPAENVRAASLPAVCSWVLDTWHSISAKMVAQSFKKCGISNLMNGTEGEILWEETEDAPSTPVDEEDEDEEVYADHLTSEEWQNLFGDSDDEEFPSFE